MKKLIIVGGGNSISGFPGIWETLIGKSVFAVNYAYKFLKETPAYFTSLDCKFWQENIAEIDKLEKSGCRIINRHGGLPVSKVWEQNSYFCGSKKLSGIFALSYACKSLNYDQIFLLGYDYGFINEKSHFYDTPVHGGIGKRRAYYDTNGEISKSINEFNYFKKPQIYIVGESFIESFPKLNYEQFLNLAR